MKRNIELVLIFVLIASSQICQAQEWRPIVPIYSSSMPGFATGIAGVLEEELDGDIEFIAVEDPSLLSSLIVMPNVKCVILAVMMGSDLREIVEPLILYFENGGAAVGFQGCSGQDVVGELARSVFPAFANATGSPVLKGGIPMNEYVRDAEVGGFENIPDQFDLLGQFFAYAANPSREPVEPRAKGGERTVLFREKNTGAPLIIAYENSEGSRSVCLTGCFVRPTENSKNYYGKLLEDPVFTTLLVDALAWTTEGVTRSSQYESSYLEVIQGETERVQRLRDQAQRAREDQRKQRALYLMLSWVIGLFCIGGLVYLGFLRDRK